jgi:eukaryotic-like serine/threonine-protein kinase
MVGDAHPTIVTVTFRNRSYNVKMTVTSAEEYFTLVEKSGLLSGSDLTSARKDTHRTDDAQAVAWRLVGQGLISRWQANQLLAGRYAFHLGKYRLIEPLGRGGMGSVYLARHVTMKRRVALKIISRRSREDPRSLERLLAEARAIASLDHPNIVQAYSIDNEDECDYFVMEYVDGIDLQRLVETEGPLDGRTAADYARQTADGLDHAHRKNMIHCDVKPSNLLVNAQGTIKILDLGLARFAGDASPDSQKADRGVLGSVDYLAPELSIDSPDWDHRADIYSLGCTLYFLLTGHPPFNQGSLAERILKHHTQEAPDVREERPDVSDDLAAVCRTMMAKDPDDRYASAAEASRALSDCLAAMPSESRGAMPPMVALLDELAEEEARLPVPPPKPAASSGLKVGLIALAILAIVEFVLLLFAILGH